MSRDPATRRMNKDDVDDVARRIHEAPSRAVRLALRAHSDGSDNSIHRRIKILEDNVMALEQECVEAAIALQELLGRPRLAAAIDDHRYELRDVMHAARIATRVCTGCGCTEFNACPGGCSWSSATEDLCTRCAGRKRAKR